MKKLSKSAWIMGALLASSAAVSCGDVQTRDIAKDSLEAEQGTQLVVGDYGNLTAAEREHYREDLQYLRELVAPNESVRLNLADPQLHRLVLNRLKVGGKSRANSPNLYASIDRTQQEHVRLGYGRGVIPKLGFRNGDEGRTQMHFISTAKVAGDAGEGAASSTIPEGSMYTMVDVGYYDADNVPLAPPNIVEQFAAGTDVSVQTDADLTQSERDAYLVDSVKVEDTGTEFNISYLYTDMGLQGAPPPQRPAPPVLEVQNIDAPVDLDGDDDILLCLSRSHADCDYKLLGMWEVKVPLAGSIHITSNDHVFSEDAIDDIRADLTGGIPNPRSGYIKLVLAQAGGGCDVGPDGALQSSMAVFWNSTTVSPDGKTLSWDMTGDDSAFFDNGCQQIQDIVHLTMRLQLPVHDTVFGFDHWVSKTLSNNPTQFDPDHVYDPIRIVNSCMAAGTMIEMADGSLVAVEDIASGDHVFNSVHDGAKGLTVMDTAVGTELKPMVRLESSDGHSVLMTDNHPIKTADRGIVLSRDLREGDMVLTASGISELVRVELEQYEGKVYNVKLGTDMEKAALGAEDMTLVYANGFLVGDMQVQSRHESIALAAPLQGEVLDRLPEQWHRDYQLSPLRRR